MTATASPTGTTHAKKPKNNFKGLAFALAVLAAAGYWYFGIFLPSQAPLELSGLVQAKEIKNASRFGGRVIKILVKEGDTVKVGQPLIQFDDIDIKAKIADARAALTEARARRSLLLAGADRGDLKQALAKVEQANQQLRILNQGASAEQLEQAKTARASAQMKLDAAEAAFKNADRMLDEGIISRQRYQEITTAYEAAKSQQAAADAGYKTTARGARPEDVKIAKSQLNAAKAQYQQLAQGAKRQDLDIANAAVAQAESNLDALEAQLSEVSLKAPISGVISVLSVSEGELVQPGRPVVTIVDPSQLWIDVYVPESQLSQVREGQAVKVEPTAIPNVWYEGKINSISQKSEFVPEAPSVNENKDVDEQAAFKVKVAVPDNAEPHSAKPGKKTPENVFLRGGMNVHVEFGS